MNGVWRINIMKIIIASADHIDLFNAMLLVQGHKVINIISGKVKQFNSRISPIINVEIKGLLINKGINFITILNIKKYNSQRMFVK